MMLFLCQLNKVGNGNGKIDILSGTGLCCASGIPYSEKDSEAPNLSPGGGTQMQWGDGLVDRLRAPLECSQSWWWHKPHGGRRYGSRQMSFYTLRSQGQGLCTAVHCCKKICGTEQPPTVTLGGRR